MGNYASDKKNARTYSLKMNRNRDEDIIGRLDQVGNIQNYIKQLIRADIAANGKPAPSPIPESREAEPGTLPAAPSAPAALGAEGGKGAQGTPRPARRSPRRAPASPVSPAAVAPAARAENDISMNPNCGYNFKCIATFSDKLDRSTCNPENCPYYEGFLEGEDY